MQGTFVPQFAPRSRPRTTRVPADCSVPPPATDQSQPCLEPKQLHVYSLASLPGAGPADHTCIQLPRGQWERQWGQGGLCGPRGTGPRAQSLGPSSLPSTLVCLSLEPNLPVSHTQDCPQDPGTGAHGTYSLPPSHKKAPCCQDPGSVPLSPGQADLRLGHVVSRQALH